MNGPAHYREAERLLDHQRNIPSKHNDTNPVAALLIAEAQVHAMLALAAATAEANPQIAAYQPHDEQSVLPWLDILASPHPKTPDPAAVLREAIRAIHYEVDGSPHSEGSCIACCQDYPCATLRALYPEGGA